MSSFSLSKLKKTLVESTYFIIDSNLRKLVQTLTSTLIHTQSDKSCIKFIRAQVSIMQGCRSCMKYMTLERLLLACAGVGISLKPNA